MSDQEWEACSCQTCQDMCRRRPCWPAPDEARQLIEMGYGKRMMLDYWSGYPDDIEIVAPANNEYEGRKAGLFPFGRCVFLTEEGLCELHNTGAKPMEGRLAMCGDRTPYGLHQDVAEMWDSEEGREVVELWRKEVSENDG